MIPTRVWQLVPEVLHPRIEPLWMEFQALHRDGTVDDFMGYLHQRNYITDAEYREILLRHDATITLSGGLPHPSLQQPADFVAHLGRGGMGEVYIAHDASLQRHVAVKRIYPNLVDRQDLMQRFAIEAQVTAQLQHPGIVPVYHLEFDEDGVPSYQMKLVRGDTLTAYLDTAKRQRGDVPGVFGEDEAHRLSARLEIFLEVCDAMAYAHHRGVIHRDLKPDNIMVGAFGEVLVMDWGIARVLQADDALGGENITVAPPAEGDDRLTQAGTSLGTAAYMSPEQSRGELDLLAGASDQYTLGLILFEVVKLERCRPPAMKAVMLAISADRGDVFQGGRDAGVPPELVAIIRKATRPEIFDRYPDMGEFAEDLRRYLRDDAVSALPDTSWRRATRWVSHHRQLALNAILGLALLVGLVGTTAVAGGFMALEASRLRAEEREERLLDLRGVVDDRSRAISAEMGRYRRLLGQIAGATELSLALPPSEQTFYGSEDFAGPKTAPPDLTLSKVYHAAVSPSSPDIFIHSSTDPALGQAQAWQLARIAPVLVRSQLRSARSGPSIEPGSPAHTKAVTVDGLPVVWAYVATEQGVMAAIPGSDTVDDPTYDPRTRSWYQRVAKTGVAGCEASADESGLGALLTCIDDLRDANGTFLGVAAVDITFGYIIDELLDPPNIDAPVEAWLVDELGQVQVRSSLKRAARTATDWHSEPFPYAAQVSALHAGGVTTVAGPDGSQQLLLWSPVEALGWTYVLTGSEDELINRR